MNKYQILKELINAWIEREKENMQDIRRTNGTNCAAYSMALGAVDAYQQVLTDIAELETEAVLP